VRALVHREDAHSLRLQRIGAEVVVADMHDPDQLADALRGAHRAYYVPLFQPHMLQAATAFATVARASNLEAIVQLSQWPSHRSHPSILTRETWLVDQLFAMNPGVAHIIVNPGMFADNFLRVIDFASLLGVYPIFTGDSRSAPVAHEDIARVVAELLVDPVGHAGSKSTAEHRAPTQRGGRPRSHRDCLQCRGVQDHSARRVADRPHTASGRFGAGYRRPPSASRATRCMPDSP
jgi:uncharacterized protein YbjT (DUF2867 family)